MSDRSDIDVRLAAVKFLFTHRTNLLGYLLATS
jgi:hypothetical protein